MFVIQGTPKPPSAEEVLNNAKLGDVISWSVRNGTDYVGLVYVGSVYILYKGSDKLPGAQVTIQQLRNQVTTLDVYNVKSHPAATLSLNG